MTSIMYGIRDILRAVWGGGLKAGIILIIVMLIYSLICVKESIYKLIPDRCYAYIYMFTALAFLQNAST